MQDDVTYSVALSADLVENTNITTAVQTKKLTIIPATILSIVGLTDVLFDILPLDILPPDI